MKVGDSFMHPLWGHGVVLSVELRRQGAFAKVRFGIYATESIPVEDIPGGHSLSPAVSSVPPANRASNATRRLGLQPLNLSTARAGVQALKLGQVLESQVERISVGTDLHEAAFSGAFKKAEGGKPQLIIIEGAWGVGKTHLLTLLSAYAAKRDFAISTTILDGCAASLSQPMRLLESITSSIRFPGQKTPMGVGTMLANVKRRGMPELRGLAGPRMVKFMDQVPLDALENPEAIAVLEDYLGLSLAATTAKQELDSLGFRHVALPPLRAQSVEQRGDRLRELLCDWAAFCVAGKAKGFLVVLDEVDVDYARAGGWGLEQRARHNATLAALGAIGKTGVPLVVAFGSAPAGPGADASIDAVQDVIKQLGKVDVHERATTLDVSQLRSLGKRVFALYSDAYPGFESKLSDRQLQSITSMLLKEYKKQLSPVPRRFVRSLLHCFDLVDLGQAAVTDFG